MIITERQQKQIADAIRGAKNDMESYAHYESRCVTRFGPVRGQVEMR